MTQAHAESGPDVRSEVQQIIAVMRESVASGERGWFEALCAAVRSWPLPAECVGDRTYRYLVGGEAFDWLLLAERLAAELDGLIPEAEVDALLFHEQLPRETSEEEFALLLGAKYKAHLNFVYGVRTEAALQMAVAEEIRKEKHATRVWDRNGHVDDEAFQRIYGKPQCELLLEFSAETGTDPEAMSLGDFSEWRYWLFKYRVRTCDPAKVASDTRKGLALLQRLEQATRQRAHTPG